MLRITEINGAGTATLRLAGKFLAPWVESVMDSWQRTASSGTVVQLDLAEVRFADGPGIEAIRTLLRKGARVDACSGFIAELLQRGA